MEELDQLKQDVRDGRIDLERLLDLVVTMQRQLHTTQQQLQAANQPIKQLEKQLGGITIIEEPFSLCEEEKRQQARGMHQRKRTRKGRRGRLHTADKVQLAERHEEVFPAGLNLNTCKSSHTRPVWRLENGGAVLVAYDIYRGPHNQ